LAIPYFLLIVLQFDWLCMICQKRRELMSAANRSRSDQGLMEGSTDPFSHNSAAQRGKVDLIENQNTEVRIKARELTEDSKAVTFCSLPS